MKSGSSCQFLPGDVVNGQYSEGQWYLATVDQALGDGNYLVSWFDGDTSNRLRHASELRPMRFNRASGAYEEAPPHGREPDAGAGPSPRKGPGHGIECSMDQVVGEALPEDLDRAADEAEAMAEEEGEQLLEVGDRVELVNLETRPELCGLTGTVVDMKEGRWRVSVDGVGNRLLHSRNLLLIPAGDGDAQEGTDENGQELEQQGTEGGEEGEPFLWDGLQPGVIVRIGGLRRNTDLNGRLGTLIEIKDEQWVVQVEGREEPMELSPDNFTRLEADDDVYEQPWDREFEPPPCYMFGSWDDWAEGRMMNWDPARSCLQWVLELGAGARESFRILVDCDPDQQLHPDCEEADPYTGFQVLGPGKNDEGLSWAVGRHPADEAAAGARYEVRLFIGKAGFYRVDWVLLGRYQFGRRTKEAPAPKRQAAGAPSAPALMPNRATLRIILQAGRPSWNAGTLDSVMEKLDRVGIRSGVALIEALQVTGAGDLNARLKSAGEKAFTSETLDALRERGNAWESEVRMRENLPMKELDIQVFKLDDRPTDGMAVMDPPSLPVQVFRVVSWKTTFVRERPCANSPAIGRKELHDEVRAKEQSFDGYVKLLGEPGWVLRDAGDEQGLSRVLEVVGEPLPLLIEEPADRPGCQRFTVTRQGRGVIRVAPDDAAGAIAFKHAGESVMIETQTYNGWLRVSADEASNGGWMLPVDPEDGQLLRCAPLEERQERRRALRRAREALEAHRSGLAPDAAALRAALALAREAGMGREELQAAEAALEQAARREAKEQEQRRLREAREEVAALLAAPAPEAKQLAAAIARAKAAGAEREELSAAEARMQEAKREEEAERKQQAKRKHLQHRIQTSAGNARLLRGCIHDGTAAGLMEEVALAETMLDKALEQEKEAARNELRQRVQGSAGKERDLLACKADAEAAGFQDLVELAERAIRDAVEQGKSTAATHEVLLAAVTAAAASNDKEEIKRAREAAKKAGIPIKQIAKAYAMGQNTEN